MDKRFSVIRDVGIEDSLTGEIYTNHRNICILLNKMNDKSDALVSLLFELQEKRRECKYE